jgi:NADPH:quinone reductase-like Zn-dependent oxidoreductase
MSLNQKKFTILGQDPDILVAMMSNIISWCVRKFFPRLLPKLLPPSSNEEVENDGNDSGAKNQVNNSRTKCISIGRPGGMEQLRSVCLKDGIMTLGYNMKELSPAPYSKKIETDNDVPSDCVVLSNECFSVNYADCTIRWGLYESAKRFVGWPITPGFDIAGTIERVGTGDALSNDDNVNVPTFNVGDKVFGCTLFGAYSNRVLVPSIQLRKIPKGLSVEEAATLPAVALTALHALSLAGYFPTATNFANKSILIHSAAGGVGSMLVQMSKILGLGPIVGVVGSRSKIQAAKDLGCDAVIDKSREDLWKRAEEIAPSGYKTIMDANGVSTLQESYDHLAATGRLVIFGFHSNLPMGKDMLSPFEWIRMAKKMGSMPAFDPMDLVVDNKSVLGFNLSFFADEKEIVSNLFDQICSWLEDGLLKCSKVTTFDVDEIGKAHALIQSGRSVGKIVVKY